MEELTFEIEGLLCTGKVERIKDTLWVHLSGRTYSMELANHIRRRRRKSTVAKKESGEIIAKMPGKVTKIFISQGDTVKEGDSILVLEAMKMEYTLRAKKNGVVEKVNVVIGDQVSSGQMLVGFFKE